MCPLCLVSSHSVYACVVQFFYVNRRAQVRSMMFLYDFLLSLNCAHKNGARRGGRHMKQSEYLSMDAEERNYKKKYIHLRTFYEHWCINGDWDLLCIYGRCTLICSYPIFVCSPLLSSLSVCTFDSCFLIGSLCVC